MIILNIGMKWNTNEQRIWHPSEIMYAMETEGWKVLHVEVKASRTEPTTVAIIKDTNFTPRHTARLCEVLRQDCFAAFHIERWVNTGFRGRGELIGPKADEWGTFEKDQFILPDRVILRRAAMQLTEEIEHA